MSLIGAESLIISLEVLAADCRSPSSTCQLHKMTNDEATKHWISSSGLEAESLTPS